MIISFAPLLTSLILVNREIFLQARLLPVVLSAATLSMVLVQVQSEGVAIFRCTLAGLLAPLPVLLSLLLSLCLCFYPSVAGSRSLSANANLKPTIVSQRLFESLGSPSLLLL